MKYLQLNLAILISAGIVRYIVMKGVEVTYWLGFFLPIFFIIAAIYHCITFTVMIFRIKPVDVKIDKKIDQKYWLLWLQWVIGCLIIGFPIGLPFRSFAHYFVNILALLIWWSGLETIRIILYGPIAKLFFIFFHGRK